MNNMKRVATEILGLEWNNKNGRSEYFQCKCLGLRDPFGTFYFTLKDFMRWNNTEIDNQHNHYPVNSCIHNLLVGDWQMIKQPWKPKDWESCYYIDVTGYCVNAFRFEENVGWKNRLYETGLLAKTEKEAQAKLEYYTKLIKENPYKEGI